jgi:hypothetical protein
MWKPHLTRHAESMLTDNFETQFPVTIATIDRRRRAEAVL